MPAISRPLLIVLAATFALLALWVVALRPKPAAVQDTPLAATREISKAKAATAISDAANAKVKAATGEGAGAAPAAAAPSKAAGSATPSSSARSKAAAAKSARANRAAAAGRDAAVVRDIKSGKVVVLLFWNPDGADDVSTRGALRGLDLHGGRVVVRVVPIARVAQYASITSGVKIAQSPTIVVIGRKRQTRVIVGLTEPREIAQAVGDALAGR